MLKRGFTLLEVLIVVIIIGILAAIALPQYTSTLEKARSAEAVANIGSLRTSFDRYWYQQSATISDPDDYAVVTDLDQLDVNDPNKDTSAKYAYEFTDASTADAENYTITATSNKDEDCWIKWIQSDNNTGKLYRSSKLGGPTPP